MAGIGQERERVARDAGDRFDAEDGCADRHRGDEWSAVATCGRV
jgi:hypothetical protein